MENKKYNSKTDNTYEEKRITWSKGSLVCSGSIFIAVVCLVFWLYISGNIQNMYDVTLLVSLVSVSGAIFGSNLVWYSKKSGSENQYKLRMTSYKEAAKVRLAYNKKMMMLMKEFNLTEEDVDKIDMTGNIDEMMDSAFDSMTSKLDESQSIFDSENTIETFNL